MKLCNLAAVLSFAHVALSARIITTVRFELGSSMAVRGRPVDSAFAGKSFSAHLHAAPCSEDGGGHYQDDTTGEVDPINENWPMVTCNAEGKCTGEASNFWAPDARRLVEGLSIVVHDTPEDNSKMLCADLVRDAAGHYSGDFNYLESYKLSNGEGYGTLSSDFSTANLRTLGLTTTVRFEMTDVEDGTIFGAHLHNKPCDDSNGGAHFNFYDNDIVDNVTENWPATTCMNGVCRGKAMSDWQPTLAEFENGLSIVVHNTDGTRMLCATLAKRKNGWYAGNFSVFADHSREANFVKGIAEARTTVTSTTIEFFNEDLEDATYAGHLHNKPCADDNGGGHYNGGDGTTVDNINENWPHVTCLDGECEGSAVSDWIIPQSDFKSGLSIVIHDSTADGNPKMLCSDIIPFRKSSGYYKGTEVDFLSSYSNDYETSDIQDSAVKLTQSRPRKNKSPRDRSRGGSKGGRKQKKGSKRGH